MVDASSWGFDDEAVVTVHASEFWIASARTVCFSCAGLSSVLGLAFAPTRIVDWDARIPPPPPVLVSGPPSHFWLIYTTQINTHVLRDRCDIRDLYEDYDPGVDRRYLMNHCSRCRARFGDGKLFRAPESVFNCPGPDINSRIAFRRYGGAIVATGRMVPIARHVDLAT